MGNKTQFKQKSNQKCFIKCETKKVKGYSFCRSNYHELDDESSYFIKDKEFKEIMDIGYKKLDKAKKEPCVL